jgi:predicted GIY-YIG superfamily endonuclease
MIYLIHIDPPVGKAKHYLGWTPDERLSKRLREHALGRGSRLTRRAVAQSSRMYLARTFPQAGPDLERIMKRHGRFKLMCPLCCDLFASMKSQTYLIDATRPEQPTPSAVLSWPTTPKDGTNPT